MLAMELAKNLKKILNNKDISMSKLAKATGVPLTTISNWLSGQAPKNIVQVKAVADYFSLSLDELVFGQGFSRSQKSFYDEFTESERHAGIYEVILRKINN